MHSFFFPSETRQLWWVWYCYVQACTHIKLNNILGENWAVPITIRRSVDWRHTWQIVIGELHFFIRQSMLTIALCGCCTVYIKYAHNFMRKNTQLVNNFRYHRNLLQHFTAEGQVAWGKATYSSQTQTNNNKNNPNFIKMGAWQDWAAQTPKYISTIKFCVFHLKIYAMPTSTYLHSVTLFN